MTDQIVRAAFHYEVLKQAHQDRDTVVVNELGLKNGENRADIAVLNGKIIGYEIKTDKDNLNRLHSQILAYNEVFDKVYIITGHKHLSKALQMIPDWWGVYVVTTIDNRLSFKLYRKGRANKSRKSFAIAQLLWKDEVKEILKAHVNLAPKQSSTKEELYKILSSSCKPNKLGTIAIQYLKSREGWRTSRQLP